MTHNSSGRTSSQQPNHTAVSMSTIIFTPLCTAGAAFTRSQHRCIPHRSAATCIHHCLLRRTTTAGFAGLHVFHSVTQQWPTRSSPLRGSTPSVERHTVANTVLVISRASKNTHALPSRCERNKVVVHFTFSGSPNPAKCGR